MQCCVVTVLLCVVVCYTVLGGVMFHFIERDQEQENNNQAAARIQEQHNQAEILKEDFLKKHPCVGEEEVRLLIEGVIGTYMQGASNDSQNNTVWDIPNSIFFSSTVITTIGYGHMSPATPTGRIMCVIYAIIGIPLLLVLLSGIGENMMSFWKSLDHRCNRGRMSPRTGKFIRCLFVILLGCVLFVFVPAAIFMYMEDWSYGTSFYYVMITLSTIGFGDYVIAIETNKETDRGVYRLCVCAWIILGLAWFATCISAIQDVFSETVVRKAENGLSCPEDEPYQDGTVTKL